MIVADTSVLIPWAQGKTTAYTDLLNVHITQRTLRVAPVSIAELMSAREAQAEILLFADSLTVLDLLPGYWGRAGILRGRCLAAGRRARLADALIAQTCIDADLPLLTNDADFDVFQSAGGLKLLQLDQSSAKPRA